MNDNQLKKQSFYERTLWPLTKTAGDRLALRGQKIPVRHIHSIDFGRKYYWRSGVYTGGTYIWFGERKKTKAFWEYVL